MQASMCIVCTLINLDILHRMVIINIIVKVRLPQICIIYSLSEETLKAEGYNNSSTITCWGIVEQHVMYLLDPTAKVKQSYVVITIIIVVKHLVF